MSLQSMLFLPYDFTITVLGNGNDDISSEEHFENSKTIGGFYLDLEVVIFVQIFEFYLLTRSL
jgi:hypothetical protein